jgi:tRNA (mo5U34)-methyltransferase
LRNPARTLLVADRSELAQRIRDQTWFHCVDLGDGLVTDGVAMPNNALMAPGAIPPVAGKTVLDIGAWDGKYSFEAERAGASRVVALDHFVWRLDPIGRDEYIRRCEDEGLMPDPEMIDAGFLHADATPGKDGFDLLHEYLNSEVEAVVDDFMTMDLETLGTFDISFYFGVLYHMIDPLRALHRLRKVTREVAVIETASVVVPEYPHEALLFFYAGNDLHSDYGNWFAPTEHALHAMCRSAGFRRVETVGQGTSPRSNPTRPWRSRRTLSHYGRMVVHAFP